MQPMMIISLPTIISLIAPVRSLCRGLLWAFLFLAPALLATPTPASAAVDDHGTLLLQRINALRAAPAGELQRLGVDLARARRALGPQADLLDQALPPLRSQSQLRRAALGHGLDMRERRYYSAHSPEGLGPRQRLEAVVYHARESDEALLALSFDAPVPPEQAVDALLRTLVQDELYAADPQRRMILSTRYAEAGAALVAGSGTIFSARPHAYFAVVEFARPLRSALPNERALLWRLINEARANPRAVVERLGLDEREVRQTLGLDAWILDAGLAPLARHELPQSTALDALHRIQAGYQSEGIAPPAAPQQSLAAAGYGEVVAAGRFQELVPGRAGDDAQGPQRALLELLDRRLRDELSGAPHVPRLLFSPLVTELGIAAGDIGAAVHAPLSAEAQGWPPVYLLVIDFARPRSLRPALVGYTEKPGTLILRSHQDGSETPMAFGAWGTFQRPLPAAAGTYELYILDEQGWVIAESDIVAAGGQASRFVPVRALLP
jgi:hypothetical protein